MSADGTQKPKNLIAGVISSILRGPHYCRMAVVSHPASRGTNGTEVSAINGFDTA